MTILEAQTQLKEINKIFLLVGDEETDREIFKLALSDLEKREIVSKFLIVNSTDVAWVLVKPLQQYEQNLTISPITAHTIAKVINNECEKHQDKENLCNPVSITDRDIQNVLKLLFTPPDEVDNEEFEE